MWLRRHFVAFVIVFAALCTIAEANLPRAETSHIEEPCGVALIGACLPRRVVAWERTHGAVVEATRGFTLLELAIVLTVIGLIVGGILWGAEMIGQATTRAQITQLQKFNTAANTFKIKYGYLPGDIPDPYASQFGFLARGQYPGEGDGNGVIEGNGTNTNYMSWGGFEGSGETAMFWVDLSTAKMMDGNFNTANPSTGPSYIITSSTSPSISAFYPAAKIGNNNYVYVWSGGYYGGDGKNYLGLSSIYDIDMTNGGCTRCIAGFVGLTVQQAYNIDKKIDDGLPQSGKVTAAFLSYGTAWASGNLVPGGSGVPGANPGGSATGSSTSCYDNGGSTSGAAMQYSMEINNGANVNCALSFQMQ